VLFGFAVGGGGGAFEVFWLTTKFKPFHVSDCQNSEAAKVRGLPFQMCVF
jgi:hypothetical protein